MIGIYKITNVVNEKSYIGSSINIKSRWAKHKSLLRYNKHENPKLQNAWNKYKEENFIFSVIEECSKEDLLEREQHYLDELHAQEFFKKENTIFDNLCYNVSCIANTCIISKEVREKIKETLRKKRELGLIKKMRCY